MIDRVDDLVVDLFVDPFLDLVDDLIVHLLLGRSIVDEFGTTGDPQGHPETPPRASKPASQRFIGDESSKGFYKLPAGGIS